MIQLPLFDMTQPATKTPYEAHSEMMTNLQNALMAFYEDATGIQPEITGLQFPVRLPDGRLMIVQMKIQDDEL